MRRFLLALKCFFLVLFKNRLPPEARAMLEPESAAPPLPPREAVLVEPGAEGTAAESATEALAVTQPFARLSAQGDGVAERGAVQLMALLQREGRLLDFLQEDIDGYADAEIGAAVRDIHRGCRKVVAEHLPVEPVLRESENATVRVDAGFDPSRIRLVGNVAGGPPFTGKLRHHGWRTAKVSLPDPLRATDPSVVAPAEVELP